MCPNCNEEVSFVANTLKPKFCDVCGKVSLILIIEESVFNILCFIFSKCAQTVKIKYLCSVRWALAVHVRNVKHHTGSNKNVSCC